MHNVHVFQLLYKRTVNTERMKSCELHTHANVFEAVQYNKNSVYAFYQAIVSTIGDNC